MIYNNLKQLRLRAKLTQRQLAEQVEVSISLIRKWEQLQLDIKKASWLTLKRLEDVLQCRDFDITDGKVIYYWINDD